MFLETVDLQVRVLRPLYIQLHLEVYVVGHVQLDDRRLSSSPGRWHTIRGQHKGWGCTEGTIRTSEKTNEDACGCGPEEGGLGLGEASIGDGGLEG